MRFPYNIVFSRSVTLAFCNPLDCSPLHPQTPSSPRRFFWQEHWGCHALLQRSVWTWTQGLNLCLLSPALQVESSPAEPWRKPWILTIIPLSTTVLPYFTTEETEAEASFFPVPQPIAPSPFLADSLLCYSLPQAILLQGRLAPLQLRFPPSLDPTWVSQSWCFVSCPPSSVGNWDRVY